MNSDLIEAAIDVRPARTLRAAERMVLVALARTAPEGSRRASPGLEKLMEICGLARSQLLEMVKALMRLGLIRRVSQGHRGRCAVYEVLPTDVASGGPDPDPTNGSGGPDPDPTNGSGGPDPDPTNGSGGPDPDPTNGSGGPVPLIDREIDRSDAREQDLIAVMVDAVRGETGRTIDHDLAVRAIRLILADRDYVTHPAAYIRAAVKRDPARFLPTPVPERVAPGVVPALLPEPGPSTPRSEAPAGAPAGGWAAEARRLLAEADQRRPPESTRAGRRPEGPPRPPAAAARAERPPPVQGELDLGRVAAVSVAAAAKPRPTMSGRAAARVLARRGMEVAGRAGLYLVPRGQRRQRERPWRQLPLWLFEVVEGRPPHPAGESPLSSNPGWGTNVPLTVTVGS